MRIDFRKTATIGATAIALLALPSLAMAAGGDDMRYGRVDHMDRDGGYRHGRDERGGDLGRSAGGFSEDRSIREFRERVRARHLGREDRERDVRERDVRAREIREPAQEHVHVARRFDHEDRQPALREPARERPPLSRRFFYEGGYPVRRFAFGGRFPGYGYGPVFRHRIAYGFGYGRPRVRFVRIYRARFLRYGW